MNPLHFYPNLWYAWPGGLIAPQSFVRLVSWAVARLFQRNQDLFFACLLRFRYVCHLLWLLEAIEDASTLSCFNIPPLTLREGLLACSHSDVADHKVCDSGLERLL